MQTWKKRLAISTLAVLATTSAIATVGPARAAVESLLSCGSTKPCLQWNNNGSGDAIKGVSIGGVALEGQTKFKSAGKSVGMSGVLGADVSTSGTLNNGVSGTSINGTGVTGTTTGPSALNGVSGYSASSFASGVYGQDSSTGFGVTGRNTSTTHNNSAAGILADGGTVDDALHATSNSANAIYAFAQSGTPLFANQGANTNAPELYLQDTSSSNNKIIQAVGPSGDALDLDSAGNVIIRGNISAASVHFGPTSLGSTSLNGSLDVSGTGSKIVNTISSNEALTVYGGGVNQGDGVFSVRDNNGGIALEVDDRGDTTVQGTLVVYGGCLSGCIVGSKRVHAVTEYAQLESEPTVEDNGEATLAGGFAFVPLDPKFANVIDTTAAYLVTVTPAGDCNGLYVAQRTPLGFTVRELRNGRGTLAFDYRIVAKRYGVYASRLPMSDIRAHPPTRQSQHG